MSTSVALRGVSLGYDRQPAVRRLDATFGPGSLTAVVGPNGAGKSTLLKGMIGELSPMGGQIHWTLSPGWQLWCRIRGST